MKPGWRCPPAADAPAEGARAEVPADTPAPGPTADELLSMLMSFDRNVMASAEGGSAGATGRHPPRGDTNTDGVLDAAELKKLTTDQAAAPVSPPSRTAWRPSAASTWRRLRSTPIRTARFSGQEITSAAITLKTPTRTTTG